MRCFLLPDANFVQGGILELPAEIRKHVQTVLRIDSGQDLELFNGNGLVATCRLQNGDCVEVMSVASVAAPPCRLTLIQGLAKGEKIELVLQKGTELGVNRFVLVPMQRSVGSLKEERLAKKIRRWEKIIQEAARQCRQFHLPELVVCCSFAEALDAGEAELKLLLWEESSQPLKQILAEAGPLSAAIIVGPEGGVTRDEAIAAENKGFLSVSLGPRILRTETAGLAMVSVLQYRYGDMASGL